MAHISLLGCGTWGSTLAQVLGRNGHSVTAWHYKVDVVAEGIRTTQSVYDLSKKYQIEMPISEGVYQILFNEKNPKEIVSELMTRDLKLE